MKLKLTILLFFVVLGLYAQKQIQPYNFSLSDSAKTETIMIYASANAVNDITFTLKDAKDEVLKKINDEEIIFKVFPFTEVSFREHLINAIDSIKPKDDEPEKKYEIIKSRFTDLNNKPTSEKRKIAVQDIRNIYQFFNALAITAFEYDTEPVAGVLKYSLNTTITKKNVEGFDSNLYFNRSAKYLRNHVFNSIYNKNQKKFNWISEDPFMNYITGNDTIIQLFENFNRNTRGGKRHKARVKFKHYAENKLKELYNVFEIKNLISSETFKNYQKKKTDLIKLNNKLDSLNTIKKNTEKSIIELEETVKIDELSLKEASLINSQLSYTESKKSKIDKIIEKIEINIGEKENILKNAHIPISLTRGDSIQLKTDLDNLNKDLKLKETEKSIIDGQIQILKDEIKVLDISGEILGKNIANKKSFLDTLTNNKHELEELIKRENANIKSKQNEIDHYISIKKDEIKKYPLWNFEVESIEVDINDGFIEHITAVGKMKLPVIDESYIENTSIEDYEISTKEILEHFYKELVVKEILIGEVRELKFVNEYPIGFSSKSDFADLHNYTLYAFEGAEKIFSLPITNVITAYIQQHQNDRLDFSPKDQVVRLPSDDFAKTKAVELKKETSSKILNVNIYSDFLGLKKQNENGLLQFEVEKNIPLWTKRMVLGVGRSSNFGLVNYINFNLTWAKIGEEDQDLQVRYAKRYVNNVYTPDRYVTFMDIIKFENTSVGADLNIASFDFPLLKARIELNAGIHYGRVKIVDTIVTEGLTLAKLEERTNLIRAYPDFILRIRPEERFGAYLRFRPFKTIVPHNEEFYSVGSEKEFVDNQNLTKYWLHRFELGTYYEPSSQGDNRFFFRYRYTTTSTWETNGYGEFQVGYLAYLKF